LPALGLQIVARSAAAGIVAQSEALTVQTEAETAVAVPAAVVEEEEVVAAAAPDAGDAVASAAVAAGATS
jgi:hypothetical protein